VLLVLSYAGFPTTLLNSLYALGLPHWVPEPNQFAFNIMRAAHSARPWRTSRVNDARLRGNPSPGSLASRSNPLKERQLTPGGEGAEVEWQVLKEFLGLFAREVVCGKSG
jgi:hypothetical protein